MKNTNIYSKTVSSIATVVAKKVVMDFVTIRAARSDDDETKYIPLIVSIPKEIADAAKLQKGDKVRMYTDGHKVCLDKPEEPEM